MRDSIVGTKGYSLVLDSTGVKLYGIYHCGTRDGKLFIVCGQLEQSSTTKTET